MSTSGYMLAASRHQPCSPYLWINLKQNQTQPMSTPGVCELPHVINLALQVFCLPAQQERQLSNHRAHSISAEVHNLQVDKGERQGEQLVCITFLGCCL
eukprot:1136952-Pelagomonas_calceolata.AAC.3